MTTMCRHSGMPGNAKSEPLLVDTSVAIALLVGDHVDHRATREAVAGRKLGLAGHAAFESFSVLTRLPGPARRSPATVARMLAQGFPEGRFLSAEGARRLMASLGTAGIAGGSVYDALVGAVAVEHGLPLASRDVRALPTYRALGVRLELLRNA
ncbi:MAG: type II toxin-antitoxin system VapC family toxin [Actinomycetota bacterium]